jgi:AraC family cel operon transcriptional repressor
MGAMKESVLHWTDKGYLDTGFEAECKFLSRFDETFPYYHDHDYFEIFLVQNGSVLHHINGQKIPLQRGALVFIRPVDRHQYERDGHNECQIINLAFRQQDMQALFRFLGPGFNAGRLLEPDMPPTVFLSVVETDQLANRLKELNTIPISKKHTFHTELRIVLLEIFSRSFNEPKESKPNMPDWLARLISEMMKPQHFIEGTAEMERLAHKSAAHLSRMFKKYLNKTPTQFINEQRLNYAANLLIRSDQKIIAIAYDSGFSNLSHFNHLFKRHYGSSPKIFRRDYQSGAGGISDIQL